MSKLTIIAFNKNVYYNAKHVKLYDPVYFRGTSRSIRHIIKKKTIPAENYVYASHNKKHGWRLSANQLKPPSRSSLLLRKEWVENNVPKMSNSSSDEPQIDKKRGYEYPIAPGILHLNDDEKFKDSSGIPVEIETRGERTPNGIYFLVKDVAKAFVMNRLDDTLIDKRGKYSLHEDYEIFLNKGSSTSKYPDSIGVVTSKNTHKNKKKESSTSEYLHTMEVVTSKNTSKEKPLSPQKLLYLTYDGMIKILYTSRSGNAKSFRTWATNTLFTIQMGTREQKEDLVSGVLGIPAKSLREVLKKSSTSVPCVYLFALGEAKCLRKSMNLSDDIPDNSIIVKYGLTENLSRRTDEHVRTYEKTIKNSKLKILHYVYIDPKYLQDAENEIKEFFKDIETPIKSHKSFKELVSVNPNHLKQIQRQYKLLHNEFSGCVRGLLEKVKVLEAELKMQKQKHKWELREKDLIIDNKEKDNKILQLQLQLLKQSL